MSHSSAPNRHARSLGVINAYMKSLGLRTRLALGIGLLAVGCALSIGWIVERSARTQIIIDVGTSQAELAFHMAQRLDQGMFERWIDIQKLATMAVMQDHQSPVADRRLVIDALQSHYPDYAWIGLTNADCKILVATGGLLEGHDVHDRPWCTHAKNGPWAGDVHEALLLKKLLESESGEPMRFVDVSAPVTGKKGQLLGVLGAHLSWAWAEEVRASLMKPMAVRNNVEILIVSKNGEVLLGKPGLLGTQLTLQSVVEARQGHTGHVREYWPDGEEYLSGYAPATGHLNYPGLGWTVLVRKPIEDALAPASSLARKTLLAGSALSVLFVLMGAFLAQRISSPITSIAESARLLRKGAEKAAIPMVDDYPEVKELSLALSELVSSISEHELELKKLNASLEGKVRSRTAALESMNQSMEKEIAAKQKAEAERSALIERLETFATRDSLTSLFNRRAFIEQVDQEIQVHRRHNRGLALVLFDIDHFKSINDNYGHPAGDAVLRAIGKEVQKFLRSADCAGRLGGEEFCLLLRQVDEKQAMRQARRLRERFEGTTIQIGQNLIRFTASFGVIAVPPSEPDREAMLKAADVALYQAKALGRNLVVMSGDGAP